MTATRYDVRSVPFLFVFDNGRMVESMPVDLNRHGLMMKMAAWL